MTTTDADRGSRGESCVPAAGPDATSGCEIRITWQIDDPGRAHHPEFTYDRRDDAMQASTYALRLLNGDMPSAECMEGVSVAAVHIRTGGEYWRRVS